MTKRQI
ncbi:uncharacterized protein FFMR_08816 [Fusarium fujikuroi]|nr:uncharacterized protein FFMR_08816 [Fusarium fujikuroi]